MQNELLGLAFIIQQTMQPSPSAEVIGLLVTLATVVGGFIINSVATYGQLKDLKLKQTALQQTLIDNKATAEQKARENEVDLSVKVLGIANESGRQVISRDATIKEMQTVLGLVQAQVKDLMVVKEKLEQDSVCKDDQIKTLQQQVGGLLIDKRKLEDDSIRKDEQINTLTLENTKLRERVKILEDSMNSTGG